MRLTFLGTGTSTGVPQLRCNCPVCQSADPCDSRLRCSAMLEVNGKNILIDCGPDFRQQMLRFNRNGDLDALLITHHHYDHVGGTDDLRPYCKGKTAFPIYCQSEVADDLHRRMPYCFAENPYPGVPRLDIHEIKPLHPFNVAGLEIMPLPIQHYILNIVGFRFNRLAYITDAKVVPQVTINTLRGIDTLVINALRREEHGSHLSLDEALALIEEIHPRIAYLTHFSHGIGTHSALLEELPDNVRPAYDGLTITIDD